MRYAIVSVNDRALSNRLRTERIMGGPPAHIDYFDASKQNYKPELERMGVPLRAWKPERGEAGAFISHWRTWRWAAENGPLMVFEDDAVLADDFINQAVVLDGHTPDDWDFVSLWVPENQLNHYMLTISAHPEGQAPPTLLYERAQSMFHVNGVIAKSYQGYGQVATAYSQKGAKKLIDLSRKYGLYGTVDCFMHFQSLAGNLNGYAPVPAKATLVSHDWDIATTVHGTGH